jgi:hypothetical protein
MTTPPNKLILVSTFRHYFLGISIALQDKKHNYHVLFIDQKYDDKRNLFLQAAKKCVTPFKSVSSLPTQKALGSKRQTRLASFTILKVTLENLRPVEIFTGNDRRLEFQYAIQYAKKNLSKNTIGSYIDDGTGSYIDVKTIHPVKYAVDRYLDTLVKKLAYGNWYKHPKRLGQGPWVERSYLTTPELMVDHKSLTYIHIPAENYKTTEGTSAIKALVQELGFKLPALKPGTTLLVLPHTSLIKDMYGSIGNFKNQLSQLLKNENNILVKYHPRDLDDPYSLKSIATLLPTTVPAEVYLASLEINRVIGDISTALMAAKWLNPSCQVEYMKTNSIYTTVLSKIFDKIGAIELKQ